MPQKVELVPCFRQLLLTGVHMQDVHVVGVVTDGESLSVRTECAYCVPRTAPQLVTARLLPFRRVVGDHRRNRRSPKARLRSRPAGQYETFIVRECEYFRSLCRTGAQRSTRQGAVGAAIDLVALAIRACNDLVAGRRELEPPVTASPFGYDGGSRRIGSPHCYTRAPVNDTE